MFEPTRGNSHASVARRRPINRFPNQLPLPQQQQLACGSIVGVDAASNGISRFVRVVQASEVNRDMRCPICLQDLTPGCPMVVALTRCHHQLHLDCLNSMLSSQPSTNKVFIYLGTSTENFLLSMIRARISMHYRTLKHACIHALSYD